MEIDLEDTTNSIGIIFFLGSGAGDSKGQESHTANAVNLGGTGVSVQRTP